MFPDPGLLMDSDKSLAGFALDLEARARAAQSVAELGFSMANDAYPALHFRQALVLDAAGKLMTVSGLASIEADSPYVLWLGRVWPWLRKQIPAEGGWYAPDEQVLAQAPDDVSEGWREWWPAGVLVLHLRYRTRDTIGWVCFLLDRPPLPSVTHALQRIALSWEYCWEMLAGKRRKKSHARGFWSGRKWRHIMIVVALLMLMLPVRQTVLAPAEVIAEDAMTIAPGLDGVISAVHVRPNQAVRAGDMLFSLDDTTLRNRLEIVRKSVAVADAELQATTQIAFSDSRSKAEIAVMRGRLEERRAELAAVQAQLARVDVRAPYDGIVVFADPDDWTGRPVATGERIMLLANPDKPGMLIHLPVADAIALDAGSRVSLILTVRPFSPISGTITETSYQASISDEGVASYRLRAGIDDTGVRIGLRGTAKLYGDRVILGYYLLRRPLAKIREFSGW